MRGRPGGEYHGQGLQQHETRMTDEAMRYGLGSHARAATEAEGGPRQHLQHQVSKQAPSQGLLLKLLPLALHYYNYAVPRILRLNLQ